MTPQDTLHIRIKVSYGFTMVEVMVVLSITAIIVAFAAPSFMNIVANNRVVAASNELVTALNLAKSEAVRSGQTTTICKSSDATQCNDAAEWNDGFLLFQDTDNSLTVNSDERIIKAYNVTELNLDFDYINNAINNIKFRPNGRINLNGHFCFKNSYKQENSRVVIITQSGRIRTEQRAYDC